MKQIEEADRRWLCILFGEPYEAEFQSGGGDLGIPDFSSEFQFSNGAFSVADSGFAVDIGALDGRLIPQSSGNMYSDMYKYQFKKVL